MKQARIAIFASGAGSNAEKIIQYFSGHSFISISLVCCNKSVAGVLDIANREGIKGVCFTRPDFYESGMVIKELKNQGITHIVLAGFLWLLPSDFIRAFENKIINIHPALLPKFGGKGMYGANVHKAVKEADEKETGITIHLVNEHYDEGKILLQKKVPLSGSETPEQIAEMVQELEHTYYPATIEKWIIENY